MSLSPGGRRSAGQLGAAAVAIVAAGGVVACSSASQTDAGGGQQQPQLVASLPPAKGQVDRITWNLPGEPATLFPPNAAAYSSGQVVGNLCEGLLKIDAEHRLTPNLATYKQVDPKTIVYTIRSDARFWDGKPVTAEDVAYSLNLGRDPSRIVSLNYINVKNITATGRDQVTVRFTKPDELFNNEMANIAGMVVQKAHAERAGKKIGTPEGGLMCSGPFKLESWRSGDSITISRNDAYWNPERRAHAKQVTFTFVTDTTALVQALNAGEIDGAYEISPSAIPALRKSGAGRLTFGPSMQSWQLDVANPGGVLGDAKVLQAFLTLVDRAALARVVFNGAAAPLYTGLSPATWPSDQKETYQQAYQRFAKERGYDLEKAKRLVAESGYAGQEIVLVTKGGNDSGSRTAQLIQQQAKQAGLKIRINTLTPLAFDQAGTDAERRKGMDLMLHSTFNATQDPLETLGLGYLPGQPYNYADFNNAEVTRLLTEARQSFDAAERARKIVAAQEIFERAPNSIPLVSNHTVTFLNSRLTGAITSFAYWSMPQMAFVGSAG
ncbi:ABC transporter substrate-binding protein [Nonomuraea typhae]|uniref:ABC transporter substrate-binding protein n=1 Tax=Nonomuraea typhae TaxID=2603600 RepID=UPI0015E2472B|nr:ABC transporter substrate-binding protein [Nonomuraea typhae]